MIILIMVMTKITRIIIIIIIIMKIVIIIKTIKFTNMVGYHKPNLGSNGTVYTSCLLKKIMG